MLKGSANNSDILDDWFPSEISPPSFISRNFKALRKVVPEHAAFTEI